MGLHVDYSWHLRSTSGLYFGKKILATRLIQHCYYQVRHTPGLWKHVWRPINLTLVVDNFGVGFVDHEHADKLLNALQMYYAKVTADWTGGLYVGISINWNSKKRYVDISMPGYVAAAWYQFNHPKPKRVQHHPFSSPQRKYGAES